MFGFAPPALAIRRSQQGVQECSTCRFESPLRKNTALRSVPNVKSRPGVLLQHLLQPQLIGGIEGALSVQAGGHQLRDVAMLGDGQRTTVHCAMVELCSFRWRAAVFCLICKPTKIKEATTATEATICAR